MKYNLSLYQKMQQKFALTPLMRQSMQLLSMSTKELNEYIDSLLEKNPFLQKRLESRAAYRDPAPIAYSDASSDYTYNNIANTEDPRALMVSQLSMLGLNKEALRIAEYLVSEMDDSGYINVDAEVAAEDLFVTAEIVEKVILTIQSMEPAGIGARDVRECLQIQLKRKGRESSLEYAIVSGFISELAQNNVNKIARAMDKDQKEVALAIKNIKKLNPRPASSLLARSAEPVIPDLIAKIRGRELFLELNRESVPQLRLYNPYEEKLEIIKDPEAREFLRNNMNEAKGLIDSLKRREETMCRVADYILKHQKESLDGDISKIKSLTMGKVAEDLKVHPSTISRTVSNKYVQINDAVVPLKSLLSHAVKKENGDTTSKASVKGMIKELVGNEDKNKPLSDKAIMASLASSGIPIKRRTVAKYRESLKILPTYLRRKRTAS